MEELKDEYEEGLLLNPGEFLFIREFDITDHRIADAVALESEQRLAVLFERLRDDDEKLAAVLADQDA